MRPNSYYHVYTHAAGSERCFRDESDRRAFVELVRERLVPGVAESRGRTCKTFYDQISVVAYALMGNHLHFVLHQRSDAQAISRFMRNLLWAHSAAFNLRHNRAGPLFMKPFHVRHCRNADDVMNEIAYVHNNPRKPKLIDSWTSHGAYLGTKPQDFVATNHGMRFFGSPEGYARFFDNYVELKALREAARRNIHI